MKTVFASIITCIALFGLSVGATQFLLAPDEGGADVELPEKSQPENDAEPEKFSPDSVPVSFRPDSVSVEAVLQMSDSIQKMEQRLIERESQIAKDEQRIELLFTDLETERDELTAFSEGIDAKLESLQRLTSSLSNTLAELDARKQDLAKLEQSVGADPESKAGALDDKVNHVKSWFEGLAPEQAADYLKEFANNGKIEFAAALLNKMPDRQKSKILGSMSDAVLVDQLISALTTKPKK